MRVIGVKTVYATNDRGRGVRRRRRIRRAKCSDAHRSRSIVSCGDGTPVCLKHEQLLYPQGNNEAGIKQWAEQD